MYPAPSPLRAAAVLVGRGGLRATPTGARRMLRATAITASASFSPSAGGRRISDYSKYLSPPSSRRRPSAIRKLAPLLKRPGMVSLGGGLPNPSTFPFKSLRIGVLTSPLPLGGDETQEEVMVELTPSELAEALQYSPTPGLPSLVSELKDLQNREHGVGFHTDGGGYGLSVTAGSQDGLTRAFEMLLDPHGGSDEIFLESPTYSGALAFLKPFGVKMTPVESDRGGLIPDSLRRALESSVSKGRKVLYVIPTAQNPSGSTMDEGRRRETYHLASEHDLIILEDDPYYFLHPCRSELGSFLSMDDDGRVLRFDSMSKVLSSGLRVGFVTGPEPLMERLNYHTQATSLHNSGVSQILVQKLLEQWGPNGLNAHARAVAEFYSQRRDALLSAADRNLAGLAEWEAPEAGMFLWIRLLGVDNAKSLVEEKAARYRVLFVPGQEFDPLDRPGPYVRVSYSTATDEEMDIAMERLARLIREEVGGVK